MKNKNVIDLFCGAGGLSEGFLQAGFNVLAANEILIDAAETFRLNHPNTKMIVGDIEKISPQEFITQAGINAKDVDMIIGGPPCQGFSEANRQRLIDDSRNHLYKYFVKFVENIKPKIFLMENVKGILNKSKQILEDFARIGYVADFALLNAKDYGVPQNRQRVFFIGVRKDLGDKDLVDEIFLSIIGKKRKELIPIKDALWGLRELSAQDKKNNTKSEDEKSGFYEDILISNNLKIPNYVLEINSGKIPKNVFNHKSRFNNKRDIEIFRRLPQGGKSDHESIADIMPYKSRSHIFKDKYHKLQENKICKTITAHMKFDCNMYIHPTQSRGLTAREAARIQSFPDTFKFLGSFTKWYLQIGNAVPPLLAKQIAESILQVTKKEEK